MAEENSRLREIDSYVRQTKACEDQPGLSERFYRKALTLAEENFRETGAPEAGSLARDLALSLADLDMQQGNMHGADVWYGKALEYEIRLKSK